MPNRTNGMKPIGIGRPKGRHAAPARHYYSSTSHTWRNPNSARESCYSDFVPCTYDERTLLTRLYKYARDFLAQKNGTSLLRSPIANGRSRSSGSSAHSPCDIEMITSSPSPTLHTSVTSCSPRSYDASYRFPAAPSPRPYIKPPSPAAFPRHRSQSSLVNPNPLKRPLSASSATKPTVDASTQYSPPAQPMPSAVDPPRSLGKRRVTPSPPRPPPEPALEPRMITSRPATASSDAQTAAASSATLAQTSSSSSQGSSRSSPKRARPPKPAVKYMPVQYETCDVKDLVLLISNMLLELIRFNDEIPLKDGRLTRFHSRAPPGIGVKDYLQRLTTHATLSPPILLSMVYYIDRLCALYPAFTISSLTVHRFLITSATVASKGLSDSFWTNNTYARVGGVSLKELALLELEFLWRVEWRIVPKPEVLVDYYRSLVERSEGFEIDGELKSGDTTEEETDVTEGREILKAGKENQEEELS